MERVTLFCFAASYAVAMGLELYQLLKSGTVPRALCSLCTAAGLLAHTIFLLVQRPPLASQFGSLLFLAWILAVFYLYGSIHHRKLAWGVFVLPLVLGLVVLAAAFGHDNAGATRLHDALVDWTKFWGVTHGALLLLAAVGVCVGFLASVMYLVQAHRLKAKTLPGLGLRMPSLERLEEMNRRAIMTAFPLLTAGLLVGAALMAQDPSTLGGWSDPKVVGALILWALFVLVLYLRYGLHLSGRRLAILTIVAFALLLLTLATPAHSFLQGGGP